MKKITVLIVDDSALIRMLFQEMLSTDPDIEVVGTAIDPYDAREKIKLLNPQVLTLDIEMPKMDGLAFLEKIMALRPMPVIMVSTLTQKGAEATIRALELGAFDYIGKPTGQQNGELEKLKKELASKIHAAARANLVHRGAIPSQAPSIISFNPPPGLPPIIAIGSSTGGVEALRELFLRLPANCPPIVMTQHMPAGFTTSFAGRLNSLSQVAVFEAENGMPLKIGHAYLAPGNRHMKISKMGSEYICQLDDGPHVTGHRPSVDVLFYSVAEAIGQRAVGIILTGMGKDGASGLLRMHQCGAYAIGQNESSCVVYGMPKAAAALGAVDIELPLGEIAGHLLSHCENERKNPRAV